MRFAIPGNDPQIHALVVGLDRDGTPAAETWRQVGAAGWELVNVFATAQGYGKTRDVVAVFKRAK